MTLVHDKIITSINILCEERVTILKTKTLDILFEGVSGQRFNNILEGNTILDIETWTPSSFFINHSEELKSYYLQGLSINCEDLESFEDDVKTKKKQIFVITSSYGASGWVIADCKKYNEKRN